MTFFYKKDHVTDDDIAKLLSIFKRIHTDNVWSKVTKDDFTTERFEAGYVNDICACKLTEDAQRRFQPNCQPLGIVVKIFPEKPIVPMNVVHKGIVCSMISHNKLGPRLVYMDEECSINEYIIGSRHYNREDDDDEPFVENVMRLLARYHTMQVPVSITFKEGWLDRFEHFLNEFPGSEDVWSGKFLEYLDENPRLESLRHEFETMDFKYLFYLAKAQHEIKCPLVFSHMDFHRLNRLVRETTNSDGDKCKEFYFVDLDSSLYSYRGYDLSSFFDSFHQSEPYFSREGFVSEQIIKKYVQVYRQECGRILGQEYLLDANNSLDKIVREIKFFVLNYSSGMMFFAATMFCQNPQDEKNIEMIIGTHKRLVLFKQLRRRFTEEGIMPDIKVEGASK